MASFLEEYLASEADGSAELPVISFDEFGWWGS